MSCPPASVVVGEARYAQRLLVVVDGIVRLTCANALGSVGRGRRSLTLLPRICHAGSRHRPAPNSPWSSANTASQSWPPVEDAEDVDHELVRRFVHLVGEEGPLPVGGRPHPGSDIVAPPAGEGKRQNAVDVIQDADTNPCALSADAALLNELDDWITKKTLVAYEVDESSGELVVNILGVFHGGQDWKAALGEDEDESQTGK